MARLPDQIQRQIDASKAHFENDNTPPADGTNTNTEPRGGADELNVQTNADNGAPPEQVDDQGGGQPPEDQNSETYAQRYRSLQGIHNAESQRWRAREADLTQRLTQLEQLLAAMPPADAAPQPPTREPRSDRQFVTDRDREEYGESLEVMRRVFQEEAESYLSRIAELENHIGQLTSSINQNVVPQIQQVSQRQAASQQDIFWQSLERLVPNWKTINNDTDFHSWLLEMDPLTGTTRQTYLEQAQNSFDANRVAAFFQTFMSGNGKYSSNATAQPTRSAQVSELEKQVAPGRSRSSSAPSTQPAQTYTRSDVATFFDEVRKGKYKGRETERSRIERDIFTAQREGRIVAN